MLSWKSRCLECIWDHIMRHSVNSPRNKQFINLETPFRHGECVTDRVLVWSLVLRDPLRNVLHVREMGWRGRDSSFMRWSEDMAGLFSYIIQKTISHFLNILCYVHKYHIFYSMLCTDWRLSSFSEQLHLSQLVLVASNPFRLPWLYIPPHGATSGVLHNHHYCINLV